MDIPLEDEEDSSDEEYYPEEDEEDETAEEVYKSHSFIIISWKHSLYKKCDSRKQS